MQGAIAKMPPRCGEDQRERHRHRCVQTFGVNGQAQRARHIVQHPLRQGDTHSNFMSHHCVQDGVQLAYVIGKKGRGQCGCSTGLQDKEDKDNMEQIVYGGARRQVARETCRYTG